MSPAPRPEEELRLLRQPDSGQLQAGPAPERQESLPLQGDVMEVHGELKTVIQPASPPHLYEYASLPLVHGSPVVSAMVVSSILDVSSKF